MNFRSYLLIFSLSITALCLSLYFQSGQEISARSVDESYQRGEANEEMSHSLKDINSKLVPITLQNHIQDVYERNRLLGEKTRVMEIGPGNGRVLLELKKDFPLIEFYGIAKDKTRGFHRRENFIDTALLYELFNKTELEDMDLPYLVFEDLDFGGVIPYEENKFDVIYSQNTLKHIKYKFELFNEIMRVLKPGGNSFHTDVPTINVYDKGVVLDMKDAMGEMRKRGIEIMVMENPGSLRFRKKKENQLFPVTPHHPVPANTETLSKELRRPEMGYNIKYE